LNFFLPALYARNIQQWIYPGISDCKAQLLVLILIESKTYEQKTLRLLDPVHPFLYSFCCGSFPDGISCQ
jgi:hypothetical protein